MNLSYLGSLAERKIKFLSSVEAVLSEKNELFNAVSIYIPQTFADANIVDFDPAWVTVDKPAVFSCDVKNYQKTMKGALLSQWESVFRQDTNTDVVLYLIVFADDRQETAGMWSIDEASVSFEPLTKAFRKLFFISYIKTLFDPYYDGRQLEQDVDSLYFDTALALAFLAKQNMKLSVFWAQVKVALPLQSPDTNACWIRSKNSLAQQLEGIGDSLITGDRSKYFYGALRLMNCENTHVSVQSEPVNTLAEVLAAWFAVRNSSGQFVGNKLSKLRLSSSRIKPFGVPSWLNSAVNENDHETFDAFDDMFIGYLATIADKTGQDCYYSAVRGVTGLAVNALMISKYVDYMSAQDCAELITDKGTLVNPVLTDEMAYKKIQEIFKANLNKFTGTRRVSGIRMVFPSFSKAKNGLTSLEAASAWKAKYVDDLDSVTITGGITEE